jgi:hypothetical protein
MRKILASGNASACTALDALSDKQLMSLDEILLSYIWHQVSECIGLRQLSSARWAKELLSCFLASVERAFWFVFLPVFIVLPNFSTSKLTTQHSSFEAKQKTLPIITTSTTTKTTTTTTISLLLQLLLLLLLLLLLFLLYRRQHHNFSYCLRHRCLKNSPDVTIIIF